LGQFQGPENWVVAAWSETGLLQHGHEWMWASSGCSFLESQRGLGFGEPTIVNTYACALAIVIAKFIHISSSFEESSSLTYSISFVVNFSSKIYA
jgi:hypothetical protein